MMEVDGSLHSGHDSQVIQLPIDSEISKIIQIFQESQSLVLQASSGSGKTTRVPAALLETPFVGTGEVWVLEPRRLAAKLAASRVAFERGEKLGTTIGYQFRFEEVASSKTRLRFLTEGIFLRKLAADPQLKKVKAVVLDEFHERHLETDLALAFLRWLQKQSRPDLRILVMSATLDPKPICEYLGECPAVEVTAPHFPVQVEYLSRESEWDLVQKVRIGVKQALERAPQGHILVFLPGVAEIDRCMVGLKALSFSEKIRILPLHGQLAKTVQTQVLEPSKDRKIILSTNIAESSLTIEGVRAVVDSGLHKQASFSWWTGVPTLKTKYISKASAVQRTGRAGRQGTGYCFRLYQESSFQNWPAQEVPEILRADLSTSILNLRSMGVLEAFSWFQSPPAGAVDSAMQLLRKLGALKASGEITELGKRMARLPLPPRFSRMLLAGESLGVLESTCILAAQLSERQVASLDVLQLLKQKLSPEAQRVWKRLQAFFKQKSGDQNKQEPETAIAKAILAGFPDRVAQRKIKLTKRVRAQEVELVFSSGGSGLVPHSPMVLSAEYFVVLAVQETGRVKIQALCPIEPDWLFELEPLGVTESELIEWDKTQGKILRRSQIKYDKLCLTETIESPDPDARTTDLLMRSVLGWPAQGAGEQTANEWVRAMAGVTDTKTFESLLARLLLWAKYEDTNLSWKQIGEVLAEGFADKTSLEGLKTFNWNHLLVPRFISSTFAFEKQLPQRIRLLSGREVLVHYTLDKEPWVESRLQDFFCMTTGPTIFSGKLPLSLHLLAPNRRPVQVTRDLAGFWERTYSEVRRELSRRYPKHAWPEDPLNVSNLKTNIKKRVKK